MMRSKKIIIFLVWICGIFYLPVLCVGQEKNPDAWEDYQNLRQPPGKVMKDIGIRPRVIGEIGAGRGRYAVRLAVRVGKTGKIYANDILESKLDYLKFRCKRDNIPNLITILGELTDPRFPEGELDMGSHSTPKDVLIKEVGAAGFELVRIETILSQDNIYIFKLKK